MATFKAVLSSIVILRPKKFSGTPGDRLRGRISFEGSAKIKGAATDKSSSRISAYCNFCTTSSRQVSCMTDFLFSADVETLFCDRGCCFVSEERFVDKGDGPRLADPSPIILSKSVLKATHVGEFEKNNRS